MTGPGRAGAAGAPQPGPSGDTPPPDTSRRRRVVSVVASVLAVGAVLGLLLVGLLAARTDTSIADALARGDPYAAPEFALPILINGRGVVLELSELRGRPVVLNFWASWCIPCRREAPRLEAAWRRHRADGLLILGLNIQDLSRDARAFVRRYRQRYPSVRDKGETSYRAYQLTGVPETFFIDSDGSVRAKAIGEISERTLNEGIAAITGPQSR
jgi:cytochrome c biogenesis protein CcmG/thiol:disulfide interchange protein DsbE